VVVVTVAEQDLNRSFIIPNWQVPENIRAISTCRSGGFSKAPYDSLNMGLHVGDAATTVMANRGLLADHCRLSSVGIVWLNQIHSATVVDVSTHLSHSGVVTADGAFAAAADLPCVVMTADCLPVLLTDTEGLRVASLHAGWRGLYTGVLSRGVAMFPDPRKVIAWLGPAIGPSAFEVGQDVFDAFTSQHHMHREAFVPAPSQNKWYADIYQLARQKLNLIGVSEIYGGNRCTYSEEKSFFSYRRDGVTGRMATMIWRQE
jgi:hypothetical protein